MNDQSIYEIGSRVVVEGHGGWPDGTTGTIVEYPGFVVSMRGDDGEETHDVRHYHVQESPNGPLVMQFVEFDEPVDDGSGDGPYRGGEICICYLRLLE